jgi:hypothetical protein
MTTERLGIGGTLAFESSKYEAGLSNDAVAGKGLEQKCARMEAYIARKATCWCCEEVKVCAQGCTFENDCPDEYAEMVAARIALYGENP